MRAVAAFLCGIMLSCLGALPSYADKRVALVIGNDRYANLPADEQLRKAVNDARAVGDALSGIGFQVIRGENLGRQALLAKFDELTQRLEPGDTALFFFAGHGVAVGGGNYILPADAPNVGPGQDMLLARASLGESDIVGDLQARGVRVAVVVLDACRNNPFKKPGVRGVGAERGLGRIEPVRGVFTIYSAGIGQSALDRLGDADSNPNSVFTRVFVPALARPGVDLKELAADVREEVARLAASVQHDQRPAYYDETVGGRVYLAGLPKDGDARPSIAQPPAADPAERAWTLAKDTTSQAVLEDFIRRFGDTFYATLARDKLEALKKNQVAVVAPPTPQPPPPKPAAPAPSEKTAQERLCPYDAHDNVALLRCYRQAADAGNTEAMVEAGILHCDPCWLESSSAAAKSPWRPTGISVNDQEAMRWFRKAADAGDARAMSYIGTLYHSGRGVPKNTAQGIAWYRKAAAKGYEGAQEIMKRLGVN